MDDTREKLIELISKVQYLGGLEEKVADHLIANGVRLEEKASDESKWIPVTEQPPKKRRHYFIAYKFKGSDMRFFGEATWHNDLEGNGLVEGNHFSNEGVEGMYVTHWMEIPKLPEPPKEVNNA